MEVVGRYLERAGYRISFAGDGHEAIARVVAEEPDLVILDIMLPGLNGLQVLRHIRKRSKATPVILLSAKGEPNDRVAGLRLGADDYVSKPFGPVELVARVQAVLRRIHDRPLDAPVKCAGIAIDPVGRTVTVHGRDAHLTRREFDLLSFLASHPGRAFSMSQLLESVWPCELHRASSTVHVHMRRLRMKIEENPARPARLKTVWGFGYRFES